MCVCVCVCVCGLSLIVEYFSRFFLITYNFLN